MSFAFTAAAQKLSEVCGLSWSPQETSAPSVTYTLHLILSFKKGVLCGVSLGECPRCWLWTWAQDWLLLVPNSWKCLWVVIQTIVEGGSCNPPWQQLN